MSDYGSNSHASKEGRKESDLSEKRIKKVISGSAKSKKKTGIQKITDIFISDDVDSVKSYIIEDILVPAIKDIILDAVRAFLGVNGRSGKSTAASKISYKSYDKEYERKRDNGFSKTRTGYSYDDVILETRGEAEEVLAHMDELISSYGLVSVADLCDLVGIRDNHTDNKYGWTDIRTASVVRVRAGYMLKLPRALPLNLN